MTVASLHQTLLRWLFVLDARATSAFAFPTQAVVDVVIVMRVKGAIGSAGAAYLACGLEHPRHSDAALIVMSLESPGGSGTSMLEIIREILASPLAVEAHVHPGRAWAPSAASLSAQGAPQQGPFKLRRDDDGWICSGSDRNCQAARSQWACRKGVRLRSIASTVMKNCPGEGIPDLAAAFGTATGR